MQSEEKTIMYQLDRVNRNLRRGKGKPRRGHRRILSLVYNNPEISTKDLAELLDVRVSSLNEKLARFIEREWVMREKNPLDQRSYLLSITPIGVSVLEKVNVENLAFREKVDGLLDQQQKENLVELLSILADGLEGEV